MDTPYYQAARFPNKQIAGTVYFPLQQMIFEAKDECDLSAYRFKHEGVWCVVVLGEKPSSSLHVQIEAKLTSGVLVSLRDDVLRYLRSRRAQASQLGSWVEGHYHDSEEER